MELAQTILTYSTDEAYQASLKYFKGDELAARVWVNKYALKDSYGNIYEATPYDWHWQSLPNSFPLQLFCYR